MTGVNTTTETFTGVFAVPTGISMDALNAWLQVSCGDGDTCDFSHTATFDLSSLNGVSYTSSSGVLLTQTGSVPEPSSWAMMLIGGLGVVSGVARKRRK